jgi:hypothetical protein
LLRGRPSAPRSQEFKATARIQVASGEGTHSYAAGTVIEKGASVNRRVLGLVLAVVGLVVGILSGLADVIGISLEDAADDSFGWIQIAGLAVGVVLVVVGLVIVIGARDDTGRAAHSTAGTEPEPPRPR